MIVTRWPPLLLWSEELGSAAVERSGVNEQKSRGATHNRRLFSGEENAWTYAPLKSRRNMYAVCRPRIFRPDSCQACSRGPRLSSSAVSATSQVEQGGKSFADAALGSLGGRTNVGVRFGSHPNMLLGALWHRFHGSTAQMLVRDREMLVRALTGAGATAMTSRSSIAARRAVRGANIPTACCWRGSRHSSLSIIATACAPRSNKRSRCAFATSTRRTRSSG
jgi:hypothetical protein